MNLESTNLIIFLFQNVNGTVIIFFVIIIFVFFSDTFIDILFILNNIIFGVFEEVIQKLALLDSSIFQIVIKMKKELNQKLQYMNIIQALQKHNIINNKNKKY